MSIEIEDIAAFFLDTLPGVGSVDAALKRDELDRAKKDAAADRKKSAETIRRLHDKLKSEKSGRTEAEQRVQSLKAKQAAAAAVATGRQTVEKSAVLSAMRAWTSGKSLQDVLRILDGASPERTAWVRVIFQAWSRSGVVWTPDLLQQLAQDSRAASWLWAAGGWPAWDFPDAPPVPGGSWVASTPRPPKVLSVKTGKGRKVPV